MKYHEYSFSWDENSEHTFSLKVLNWANQFNTFIYFNSNHYPDPYGAYDFLLAAGVHKTFQNLEDCPQNTWLFGHHAFPPNLELTQGNWEECYFFQPQMVIALPRGAKELVIYSMNKSPQSIYDQILSTEYDFPLSPIKYMEQGQWLIDFDQYKEKVEYVQKKIKEGVCEEMNLCIEYEWKEQIDRPIDLFHEMNKMNPCPFAAFYKLNHQYALSTSPERFFTLNAHRLITQPIKGTIGRGKDMEEEEQLKNQLKNDPKERLENETITQMVFEELKKLDQEVEVEVIEEQQLYTFPTLHHLISTLSASFKRPLSLPSIFEVLFPMGSMTGTPKKEVLKLTHEVEPSNRGLYSGTIGYQSPQGNWDFNVVIRTLIYDALNERCSFHTGGAITSLTDAEREWNEIQLKASFFKNCLK